MERIVFLDSGALVGGTTLQPEGVVRERVENATIVITNRTPLTERTITSCQDLKLVVVAATGYDLVDLKACSLRKVTVCNVQDWAISLHEHVFSLALALRRQLLQYRQAIAEGGWARTSGTSYVLQPMPQALSGSTLGIIGYGTLAKRVERVALAFDMSVMIAERRGAPTIRAARSSFDNVIKQSDVLVLLCPLNADTRGLISFAELSTMKTSAILINCARGGVIDEQALAAALKDGTIAGAGIDVLAQEPPPATGNPLLELSLPNLIVTSHVAWCSTASAQNMLEQLILNLEAFVRGVPRNVVS